jgi:hypothetical protein
MEGASGGVDPLTPTMVTLSLSLSLSIFSLSLSLSRACSLPPVDGAVSGEVVVSHGQRWKWETLWVWVLWGQG